MNPGRPLLAALSAGLAVFVVGSLVVLLTETVGVAASLVTTLLLLVALAGAVALGARSRRWLANPYW